MSVLHRGESWIKMILIKIPESRPQHNISRHILFHRQHFVCKQSVSVNLCMEMLTSTETAYIVRMYIQSFIFCGYVLTLDHLTAVMQVLVS